MSAGSRPKGYMTWRPSPDVLEVVEQSRAILREYGSYGPMTVRQIFYRLVGSYGYPKDERAYKRLAEYLVKARRAQLISFHAIRDDGGTTAGGGYGFETVDEFLTSLSDYGRAYRISPALDQPYHIEVWCEAEGMVPMLGQIVRPYGASVTGTGGFSSLTVTEGMAARIAQRWDDEEQATVLLHLGDYDPSGVSIYESMCQDIGSFVSGKLGAYVDSRTGAVTDDPSDPERRVFIPERVALTQAQVAAYGLPTAPPKASDSRSNHWHGETTQAEAMPPDLLADVLREAVKGWFDQDIYDGIKEREASERALIGSRVSDAVDAIKADLT